MDSIETAEWFAVRVRPSFEQIVFEALTARGLEAFSPTYTSPNHGSNGTGADAGCNSAIPLFSGYLFCRTTLERCIVILHVPGVRDVVSFGRTPVAIPNAEIDAIRRISQAKLKIEPHPFCAAGQVIRIERGPLAGIEGVFTQSCPSCKIVVSVSLLRKSISAELDISWISSAADSSIPTGAHAGGADIESPVPETSLME